MRAAREKQGLHIAALAAAIKVSPRKLDALENDRWHELPDATFVRALAQTVCRTLKVDAKPVLAMLPITGEVVLEPVSNVLNEPFRDRPGRDGGGFGSSAIRPMVMVGLLLLVAAVVVYFLPASLWTPGSAPPAVATTPAATPAVVPAAAALWPASAAPGLEPAIAASGPASLPVPAAEPAAPAAPGLAPGVTPSNADPAARVPAPQATAPATMPPAAAAAPVPAAAPSSVPSAQPSTTAASAPLQLRSTQASWVDVRDARGTVLLSRIVQPGEAVGLDGALPLRLTIGNAAGTQLVFRGKAVDLTGRVRENVARLELQ